MTKLIRASSLIGYRELVIELGGNPDHFLQQFNIRPDLVDDETALYPLRSFVNLLELTASEMKCPDFGLRLAEVHGGRHLGPLGVIGLNASSVGEAMNDILRYLDFHCPALEVRLDKTVFPGKLAYTWDFSLPEILHRTQIAESAVGNILQELKILTQGEFVPEMVFFRHSATKPVSVFRKYFQAPVFFEQEVNGVVLNPEVLSKKLNQANPLLHKLAMAYVCEGVNSQQFDIGTQVRFTIKRLLPTMNCGIVDVAQNLCMHERALQRKLKSAGLVFEDIADSVRETRARELLEQSDLSMAQISEALGYAEQASFNHACLRWFGMTPTKVRLQAKTANNR